MEHFAGLDVSVDKTAICVVGDNDTVVLETEVETDPAVIGDALKRYAGRMRRIGHEAGSLSPWLHAGLPEIGIPAVCLKTRHARAALSAQRNKMDAAIGSASITKARVMRLYQALSGRDRSAAWICSGAARAILSCHESCSWQLGIIH